MKIVYLLTALFFLLAWLLPNHYLPWLSVYQESCIFISALLLSFILIKKKKIEVPYVVFAFIFFIFLIIIQYINGMIYFRGEAVIYILYILFFTLVFVIGFNIEKIGSLYSSQIMLGFAVIIITASIISVWLQFRQWLLFDGNIWVVDMPPLGRPFANIAQPNQLSTLLIMGLLSTVYLFEHQKIGRSAASLAASFLIFGIVLTQSRTAWLFTICILTWWYISYKRLKMRIHPLHIVAWAVVFLGLWISVPLISSIIGVDPLQSIIDRTTTGADRFYQWEQILFILKDSPFWGYGWGQLNVAQLSNESKLISNPIFGYSHNLFLDLMVWNGVVIGFIISLCIIIFLLRLGFKTSDNKSVVLLSIVGAVLVHSMLEYPFAYAYFLMPLGLILGLVYGKQEEKSDFFYLPKIIYVFSVCGLAVLTIICSYDYKRMERAYEDMRYENVKLKYLDPDNTEHHALVFNQLSEYIWFVRQPLTAINSKDQLERMRRVAFRYPDRPILYKYIQILYLNEKYKELDSMLIYFNAFYQQKLTVNEIRISISGNDIIN